MDDSDGASLASLIRRFERVEAGLQADDSNRHFCVMYLRSTQAVAAELDAGGFRDPDWTARWTGAFADLYLDAFDGWREGGRVPRPWRLAFQPRPSTSPLLHQLIGLNAHLNFDLPQALLAVVSDEELHDPALLGMRRADFARIDEVMLRRIPEEYRYLRAVGGPVGDEMLARLLYPVNLLASRRWLVAARQSVWRNAVELSSARQVGRAALARRLAELEVLCAARVAQLLQPGPVLLRLAVSGFGVDLPPADGEGDDPPGRRVGSSSGVSGVRGS